MKHIYSLLIILFLGSINGCMEPGDTRVFLTNNSSIKISSFVADGFHSGFSYPDTTLPSSLNDLCVRTNIADSCEIWAGTVATYKGLLATTQMGILSVYLFSQEAIDEYGWKSTLLNGLYLVRYDLTVDDLNTLIGRISFPPSDQMKNVKMYPPYEVVCKYE